MSRLQITEKADLDVYFKADSARYDPALLARHGIDRNAFAAYYGRCPSIGFALDDIPIGGVLLDGDRLHIAVLPEYHGRWAFLLKPTLQWCFSLGERFYADIEIDNEKCIRFMDGAGWQRVESSGGKITYEIVDRGRTEGKRGLNSETEHECNTP